MQEILRPYVYYVKLVIISGGPRWRGRRGLRHWGYRRAFRLLFDDIRSTARYRSAVAENLLEEFLHSLK